MKIELWLKNTSQPRTYCNTINTFQEGYLICIQTKEKIYKYPIYDIFRLVEIQQEELVSPFGKLGQ